MEIEGKTKRSCAQLMLMKSKGVNGVGVVGKADKKSACKGKEKINEPTRGNKLYHANGHNLNTFSSFYVLRMHAILRSQQAQAILIATMHDVGIRCVHLRHIALPTALYLHRFLVLSIEVRACHDSAVNFTGNKLSGFSRCDL